jgi:hypothetical protein
MIVLEKNNYLGKFGMANGREKGRDFLLCFESGLPLWNPLSQVRPVFPRR